MAWKREGGGYFNDETNLRIFKIEDPQTGKFLWQVQDLNGAPVGDLYRTLKEAKGSTE